MSPNRTRERLAPFAHRYPDDDPIHALTGSLHRARGIAQALLLVTTSDDALPTDMLVHAIAALVAELRDAEGLVEQLDELRLVQRHRH